MGGRQSKRAVDISTTPTKEKSDVAPEKIDKIDEPEYRNGSATHPDEAAPPKTEPTEAPPAEPVATPDDEKKEATENGEENKIESATSAEEAKAETKTEEPKRKPKNKWSFRSVSFLKKDKPNKDLSPVEGEKKDDEVNGEDGAADEDKEKESVTTPPVSSPAEETPETPDANSTPATTSTPNKPEKEKKSSEKEKKKKWSFRGVLGFPKKDEASKNTSADDSTAAEDKTVPEVVEAEGDGEKADEKKTEATPEVVPEIVKTPASEEEVKKPEETPAKVESPVKEVEKKKSPVEEKVVEAPKIETEAAVPEVINKVEEKPIESPKEEVIPQVPSTPPPEEPIQNLTIECKRLSLHEEMNGGGESMAEIPEENGLNDSKIENEKLNGYHVNEIEGVCKLPQAISEKQADNDLPSPSTNVPEVIESSNEETTPKKVVNNPMYIEMQDENVQDDEPPQIPLSLPPELNDNQRLSLHEEANGGGEGMAEILEENGLSKIVSEENDKLNGFHMREIDDVCIVPQPISEKLVPSENALAMD